MEFVHVLNRGVDKRIIFLDDRDRFRFIHDLFEFNDQERINNVFYLFNKDNDIASRNTEKRRRKLLVNIHAFCLMPNHYHLLLSPRVDDGVAKFMKKLGIGYAKYFNIKYERKGTLFEGRYKSIKVKKESHFIHLPYYIHLNPLDLFAPEWRQNRVKNLSKALEFLKGYRWSSFLDYIGIKNFPSVTRRDFLLEFLGGTVNYNKKISKWLSESDLSNFSLGSVFLE